MEKKNIPPPNKNWRSANKVITQSYPTSSSSFKQVKSSDKMNQKRSSSVDDFLSPYDDQLLSDFGYDDFESAVRLEMITNQL